jgi:hypothetical protein
MDCFLLKPAMLMKSSRTFSRIGWLAGCALAALSGQNAKALTLSWDPSPDAASGKIAGYRLYYSTQSFSALPADAATNPAFSKVDVGSQTSATIASLPSGQVYLGVTAYDTSGAESSISNVVPFNNGGPIVSLTSPSAVSFLTTDLVVITASASSPSSTIAKVDFYDGSTLLTSKTASPYTLTQAFTAGTHTLTAQATDGNNVSATSAAVTITVNNPTAPQPNSVPTVTLSSPSNNSTYLTNAVVTIAATASDSDGTVAKVEFFDGATLLGAVTVAPFSISTTSLAPGVHSLTAKATDNLGATSTSGAVTISVNANQAPVVALSAPANNSTYLTNASVTISATATDADGTVSKVEFFDGATLLGSASAAPYSFSTTALAAGSHSITAKATDNLGASTTSTAATVTIVANQAPTVSISSPARSSIFLTTDNITITAKASDTDGTITKVDFMDGTTLLGTATSSPYAITVSGLIAGSHTLKAKATDNTGTSTTSRGVSITVKASTPPTVAITSPANNSTISSGTSTTIAASASDADGTVSKVDFYDGATLLGTATTSPYSIGASLADGAHVLTARATDNSGLSTASSTVNVSVGATVPPTVALVGLNSGAKLSPPFVLTASASSANGTITQVEFFAGTNSLGIATTAPYSISASIYSGTYTFTAQATDNSGAIGISAGISATVKPAGPHSLTVK